MRTGVFSTVNQSMTHQARPDRLEVQLPLRVKPYDIDVVGVVSNIVYVRWMEDLRLAMLDAYLPLDEQMADRFVPAILKVEIEYKRAIQIHDEVLGTMWLSGLEKLRFEVSAEFRANGHIAAVGRQEGCFINLCTKRPVRPPAKLVATYRLVNHAE
jgi:acyl-CoA thioester hydrolase